MEQIKQLLDEVKENFEDIGLYLVDANVSTSDTEAVEAFQGETEDGKDFREKLIAGEALWMIHAQFSIGDVAWTDRVLNPKRFDEDTEFRMVMPTEAEILAERMREAGGDPMKLYELMMNDEADEAGSD